MSIVSSSAGTTSASSSSFSSFLDSLCRQLEGDDPDLAQDGLSLNSLWNLSDVDLMRISDALLCNTTLTKLEYTIMANNTEALDVVSFLKKLKRKEIDNNNNNNNFKSPLEHLAVNFGSDPPPDLYSLTHSLPKSLRLLELTWLVDSEEEEEVDELGNTNPYFTNGCILTPQHVIGMKSVEQVTIRNMRLRPPYNTTGELLQEELLQEEDDNDLKPTTLQWREVTLDACFVDENYDSDLEEDGDNNNNKDNTLLWWFPLALDNLQILRLSRCPQISNSIFSTLEEYSINQLVVLDLSDCQLDYTSCTGLAKALDASPHLLELCLADNPSLGSRGIVDHLCHTIIGHSLQRLDVANCQVDEQALRVIVDTFPFLRAINLTANPIRRLDCLWENGRQQECYQEIVLEGMTCGLDDESVAEWLRRAPPTRINLSGNVVREETLRALAVGCEIVILAGCQLGDEGLETLLTASASRGDGMSTPTTALPTPMPWTELYIPYNNITNQGISSLVDAFGSNKLTNLRTLSMEYNNFDTVGLQDIAESFIPYKLQELSLWNHQLSSGSPTIFQNLQARLDHLLQLNRAGKSLLYEDGITPSLWPLVFAEADAVYGPDALFDFLQVRPDVVHSSVPSSP